MVGPFSEQDLILLGYEEIVRVDIDPTVIVLSGKAKAGIVETTHTFIYVKTDATREAQIRVAKQLQGRGSVYFLRSKSGPSEKMLRTTFGNDIEIYLIDDLLWERVRDLFRGYIENLSRSIPVETNYIAPRGNELDPKDRLDRYLIEYFSSTPKKKLVVLKANAGVGKTTLCRQLVMEFGRAISSYRIMPVYVEAAHWGGRVTSASGLWDIIQMSLQGADPGSSISRSLFEAALKRGLILFVFDGFDELCSSPRSNISASEVMESLREWSGDSEARIVLTTRTPYWEDEVGEDPEEAYSLHLLPFNPQQAKEYIKKYFDGDDTLFQKARSLYAEVTRHAKSPTNSGGARAQFWTLPIAVSMICDAVKAGVSEGDWHTSDIESLLVAVCERESKRQRLALSGSRQLEIFTEFALLEPDREIISFERDDLLAAGVSTADVEKFSSHPLVRRLAGSTAFCFSYDFLTPYLRALAIRNASAPLSVPIRSSILCAMSAEENGKGFLIEHACHVLESVELERVYAFLRAIPLEERAARSFMVHLLLRLSSFQPDVVEHKERAALLLRGFADVDEQRVVRSTRFMGMLDKLDLSGLEFVDCEFIDVTLKNVDFAGCVFRSCRFDGEILFLDRASEQRFAQAKIAGDCEMLGGARMSLAPLLETNELDRTELIKDLIESGLSKFWHNGKLKAGIRKADWKKGALGRSRSSDVLLDVFRQTGLVVGATMSGVQEGGWIFNRDAIGDLQNFMDHRRLTGPILVAFNEIERTLRR